jgi:MFS family permease
MGTWLDRFGPKKVVLSLLAIAVLGCCAFAMSSSFIGLLSARVLTGVGVSACLMGPLTAYRRWYAPISQMRANSWMLMTGSLGMVASTLPVQWLMPITGWRLMFWLLALLIMSSMGLILLKVPNWRAAEASLLPVTNTAQQRSGYAMVWRHPFFRAMAPMGFFIYGGLVAMQTLWVAPWMTKVTGLTAMQAAESMFWLNVAMLITFWVWGLASPALARRGWSASQLIGYGMPMSFLLLAFIIVAEKSLGIWTGVLWALYCMACTVISLAQPAVAMSFPSELAGRALSAFNLVVFAGVFVVQWGIGLGVDAFLAIGMVQTQAFQSAMGVFLIMTVLSYAYFLYAKSHNLT